MSHEIVVTNSYYMNSELFFINNLYYASPVSPWRVLRVLSFSYFVFNFVFFIFVSSYCVAVFALVVVNVCLSRWIKRILSYMLTYLLTFRAVAQCIIESYMQPAVGSSAVILTCTWWGCFYLATLFTARICTENNLEIRWQDCRIYVLYRPWRVYVINADLFSVPRPSPLGESPAGCIRAVDTSAA